MLDQEGRDVKIDQTETVTMGAITRAIGISARGQMGMFGQLAWLIEVRNHQQPEMKLLKHRTGIGFLSKRTVK